MPSIEENQEFWNRFHWADRGDTWSDEWGGPEAQWQWCVYPRIRRHLPAETILEIGPGMGRWTQFLRRCCENLIIVDISQRCLDVCRERFGREGISYRLGDGRTLSFLENDSVDFVFSFESLILTESEDLRSYLAEMVRTMKPAATAFLHHSNLGSYKRYYDMLGRVPQFLRERLQSRGILDFDGWRARTVSQRWVRQEAEKLGLGVLSQEVVPWGGKRLIDCFTTLRSGHLEKSPSVLENRKFVDRAREIRRIAKGYAKREHS